MDQRELNLRLLEAAIRGDTKSVEECLARGADVNCKDLGQSPLFMASGNGHTETVSRLVDLGADIDAKDKNGCSPLFVASLRGHTETVARLVDRGADINAKDNKGKTPLESASGKTKILLQLIQSGVNVSQATEAIKHCSSLEEAHQYIQSLPPAATLPSNTPPDGGVQQTDQDVILPGINDAKEFKSLLSKGTYESHGNRIYLAGACNVGKSTLASLLIGDEIPLEWNSTDGLRIFFGRNGIDLEKRQMVPMKKDEGNQNILYNVLQGNPSEERNQPAMEKSQQKKSVSASKSAHSGASAPQAMPKSTGLIRSIYSPQTTTKVVNSWCPKETAGFFKEDKYTRGETPVQKLSRLGFTKIHEDIKQELRKGKYKVKKALSDLVDFGGQRSYDMTHQLFIQGKGTFTLIFDGRKGLHDPLAEYPQGDVTTESILKHWVDSILTYCGEEDDDIVPVILFVATHRDKLTEHELSKTMTEFKKGLEIMFQDHERKNRIMYNDIFFINGTDINDQEVTRLKTMYVDIAFQQKSWGKRMPMAWVPLELQMSEMRAHKISLVSKNDLVQINESNDDLKLTNHQLDEFLRVQHRLGKIMYFEGQGLAQYIILQPTTLVDILRSFITDEMFWPLDTNLKGILKTMTETGKIKKEELFRLWSQKEFNQHMPHQDQKEFVAQVLTYLDLLVKPKRNNTEESTSDFYLVPCMVKREKTTHFGENLDKDKAICLSYTLLKSSIPSALSFKLIAAAMNVWPLKESDKGVCLYHKAAILSIDKSNELHLLVRDNRVIVYLVNEQSKHFISPDIASCAQECLTLTLTSALDFYHNSFGKLIPKSTIVDLYEIEVGEKCVKDTCYISPSEAQKTPSWICKFGTEHKTKYPLYWIYDKQQKECQKDCKGLESEVLNKWPSDKHLVRLAREISIQVYREFVMHLGLSTKDWEEVEYKHQGGEILSMKFDALTELKKIVRNPSFKELRKAIEDINANTHILCQIFREDTKMLEIDNLKLMEIPDDLIMYELSRKIGNCAVHLGIELGVDINEINASIIKYNKDMFGQNHDILMKWKGAALKITSDPSVNKTDIPCSPKPTVSKPKHRTVSKPKDPVSKHKHRTVSKPKVPVSKHKDPVSQPKSLTVSKPKDIVSKNIRTLMHVLWVVDRRGCDFLKDKYSIQY